MEPAGPLNDSYSFAPSVLLVADAPAGHARGREAVSVAGGRVRAAVAPDAAVAWLAENAPVDVVLADVATGDAGRLLPLIDCLVQGVPRGRQGVVAVPVAMVDEIAAPGLDGSLAVLADPSLPELAAALMAALTQARAEPELRERDGGSEPARLRQLSEEVGRIARTLAELSGVGEPRSDFRGGPPMDPPFDPGPEISATLIRATIRGRRLRDQFFESRLFADPAWDMMLDLMAARLEGRQVAVSSLCIAAAVPATTALRWIKTLVEEGLFVRVADPRDGRRVFIELSQDAADAVRAYFNALAKAGIALA